MIKKMLLLTVLCATSLPVKAEPYFRIIDPKSPSTSVGALFSSKGQGLGATKFANMYAIVYHKADPNNTLIPESWRYLIPPESWVLLQVGWAANAGVYRMPIGSSVNLFPVAQNLLSKFADRTGADGLAAALAYNSEAPLQIMAGFVGVCSPLKGGVVQPFNKLDWEGDWVVGPAYRF